MTYTVAKTEINSWHADGSPIIVDTCGHKHRSLAAANRCCDKLMGNGNSRSAYWMHAHIRHSDWSPLTREEAEELDQIELEMILA